MTGNRRIWVAVALVAVAACAGSPAAAAPPAPRTVYATGKIVAIPASIPHEEGDMVDRRIVPNLRWIAARFPIYVTDGYSGWLPNGEHVGCHGCHVRHSDHYNGLAVDIVPRHWSDRCDIHWRGITRLAHWAEPRQNDPSPPFRWVGYDGDAGHGCGDHLHLSWEHARAPVSQLAEWVSVFSGGARRTGPKAPQAGPKPPPPSGVQAEEPPPEVPRGGVSSTPSGGIALRGD